MYYFFHCSLTFFHFSGVPIKPFDMYEFVPNINDRLSFIWQLKYRLYKFYHFIMSSKVMNHFYSKRVTFHKKVVTFYSKRFHRRFNRTVSVGEIKKISK